MRTVFILFILTITTQLTVGQTKTLTADSDTVFWYKFYSSLSSEIWTPQISKSNDEFTFRFWDGVKVIDLTYNQGQPQATAVFFLRQYKRNKEGRLYFKRFQITNEAATKIYGLVKKYDLIDLPTDKQITKWRQGLDGITYITEQSDRTTFSFKNYWTPVAQNEVKEAGQILDFITELEMIDELKAKYKTFMGGQPFTSWYGGIQGETIVTKITNAH
jgi:hypothetical protein